MLGIAFTRNADSRHRFVSSIVDFKSHLQAQWPQALIERFRWTAGRIEKSLPGFGVFRLQPPSSNMPWIYVSDGASKIETEDLERFEFFFLSPKEDPQHIETLAMLADFSLEFSLHVGKILDIGQPWIEGSRMTHLLVSLPYPYGPKLEIFGDVRILWLLPIFASEAQFAHTHGVDALEQLFDQAQIDAVDPHRKPVA